MGRAGSGNDRNNAPALQPGATGIVYRITQGAVIHSAAGFAIRLLTASPALGDLGQHPDLRALVAMRPCRSWSIPRGLGRPTLWPWRASTPPRSKIRSPGSAGPVALVLWCRP